MKKENLYSLINTIKDLDLIENDVHKKLELIHTITVYTINDLANDFKSGEKLISFLSENLDQIVKCSCCSRAIYLLLVSLLYNQKTMNMGVLIRNKMNNLDHTFLNSIINFKLHNPN